MHTNTNNVNNKLKGFVPTYKKDTKIDVKVTAAPSSMLSLKNIKLPPINQLKKTWKKFERHNAIYESSIEAYRYIGRILTSKDFQSKSSNFYDSNSLAKQMSDALLTKDNNFLYMAIRDKSIETRVTLPDIGITIPLVGDQQALLDTETIIQSIFGSKYKTPKEWTRIKPEDTDTGTSDSRTITPNARNFKTYSISVGENLTNTISLENIVTIKSRYRSQQSDPKKVVAERFALEKSFFDSKFNKLAALKLTLVQNDTSIASAVGEAGSLVNATANIYMTVKAEIIINWPLEFAFYATCTDKADDFIPFIFFQYITWHRVAYGGGRGRGGGYAAHPPARISNLGNIIKRNDKERAKGRNPKIRANEDGFVILGVGEPSKTGEIYWIPDNVNKIPEYLEQIKKAYNSTENKMELHNVKLKGEGLYSDSYSDKFTYFRETGTTGRGAADISGVQTIDLTGSTPLDRTTIYLRLTENLKEAGAEKFDWFLSIIRKFVNGEYRNAKPTKQFGNVEYLRSLGLPKDYNFRGTAIDFIKDRVNYNIEPVTWANIGGYPLENVINGDLVSESNKEDADKFLLLRTACKLVKAICDDMLQQFDTLDIGYIYKLDSLRFYMYLISKYSGYMDSDPLHPQKLGLIKQFNETVQRNSTGPISDKDYNEAIKNLVIPNLSNLKTLMPHQVESSYYLRNNPYGTLLESSPGGGKTLESIREACTMLHQKKIEKALIIVPGNLVRNWINEIAFFSQGKINGFALTIQSLRRLQAAYTGNTDPTQKPDYINLKKILDGLPPNTIVVTSYNFLGADRETIVYGNESILRLYAAEFLRDLNFTYVGIDESHYSKNLNSNRTLGVSIVQSSVKYKRALSGTTVNDSLDDLIGQAGVMYPVALGSESRFNSRYTTSSGAIKGDAHINITKDMKPYIQRIVHKRQKWASQLPRLSEQFHPVRMTSRQAEFYDQLLRGALDEIKAKNPKLAAKMIDGGSESDRDNNSIQQGLGMYLQAVEQFIYAPDSNTAFTELDGLEPEDLVSPKIAELTRILTNHFSGYIDASGNKIDADTNKVIIFSHRKHTSEHIMRHLPTKFSKIAVRYVAGDFKALQSFLKDDRIRIIVADEISINTGQNFQLASRMIRLETLWSPGDQEQALARIWRPDLKSGIKRDRVFLDWIFTDLSLEVCKIGRLISKIVVKMKYDQQDNTYFTNQIFKPSSSFVKLRGGSGSTIPQINQALTIDQMLSGSTLKLVKMSTYNMLNFNTVGQLGEYFDIYALANHWEDSEFERLAKDPRYAKSIDLPSSAYVEIEGSATIPYYPRIPGVEPATIDPNDKMGYKPISVIENEQSNTDDDSDDEEEGGEEINPVSINDLVDTEFGIGHVTKIMDKEIWVNIRGLREVKVPKSTAWIITNENALTKLEADLAKAGKRGIVRLPPQVASLVKTSNIPNIKPVNKPSVIDEDDNEEEDLDFNTDTPQRTTIQKYDQYDVDVEDDNTELEMFAELIDGSIALTAIAEDSDTKTLLEEYDFKIMDDYVAIRIKTVDAYDRVLKTLQSKYKILDNTLANINFYRKFLQNQSLNNITNQTVAQVDKFFNVEDNRPVKDGYLRPYPIVWGKVFMLAFNKAKTPHYRNVMQLVKGASIPNVKIGIEQGLVIKFYKSGDEAVEELQNIGRILDIPNKEEAISFLKATRKKAITPVKPLFNRRSVEDTDEEEEEEAAPIVKKPIFQLNKAPTKPVLKPSVKPSAKPKTEVLKPIIQKKEQVQKTANKPIFKFNLGGKGKVR